MNTVLQEDIMLIAQVTDICPVSRMTAFRWAKNGVNGIKLETDWQATHRVTSRQAVERFLHKVREAKSK